MDGINQRQGEIRGAATGCSGKLGEQISGVILSLEENLKILEGLELTLPVALLDHAIAELRKQANG